MPLVSFCLSTYKRPGILRETLESIRRQNFTDYEVVVSDNDPDCTAREAVQSINDERFKYFPNGKNLGMKPSFNKSLERSAGEYIVMMADDDPVYYDMLSTLVELKKNYPGYGMYMGGSDWLCMEPQLARLYKFNIGANSCLSNEHPYNHVTSYQPGAFLKAFYERSIFPHYLWSCCIVRRDILINAGGIPEYGTPFMGDFAYLSISAAHSGCVVINKSLGCQALHQENFGREHNDQLPIVFRNFPAYLEKHLSHLEDWPAIKKSMLNFMGLWAVSHFTFLYNYSRNESRAAAAREVFAMDYVKKYRLKYFLKTRMPQLHDTLVKLRKK